MTPEQRERIEEKLAKLKPGEQLKMSVDDGHEMLVMVTDQVGIHSSRPRFLVVCVTCESLVHEATTGPVENITHHVRS